MRAREFICEDPIVQTKVKLHPEHSSAIPNAHRVAGTNDRHYSLNRIMMAVASADGVHRPVIPKQSWAGTNNIATPYTHEELHMLKHAYEAAGADWDDIMDEHQRQRSMEPDEIHRVSPTPARKKNRYGV